ncbi:unnamed protein product, partial [Rotaria sp. Silwood1]
MATARKRSNNEIDEVSSGESETESEMEIDDETGSESDSSDSVAENAMDLSDNENIPSAHTYNHTLRSWQKGNFRPTLFAFQDNNCGITVDLAENTP